jgi:protein O-GlcNAc transferase
VIGDAPTAARGCRPRPAGRTLVLWASLLASGSGLACRHGAPAPSAVARPIVPAVLAAVKNEARAEFATALLALGRGTAGQAEARSHLLRATELEPGFFEAWHDLGWLDASRGNFVRAASELRTALDIQPASRPTALALGESMRRAGQLEKAARFYGERLAAAPGDPELRNCYIQALRDAGELPEALAQTRLALGQAGGDVKQTVRAYNSLGLIYYKMQKYELAEAALRKASTLDGRSAFVWNNLGLVAFARGRDQEAFLHFQRATELDPSYVEARLNKAVVYLDCGDYGRAHAELQRAIDASATDAAADADVYVALGVASRGQGRFDEARRAYAKALELEPEHAAALFDSGILSMDYDKDPARARASFQAFTELAEGGDPRRQEALDRLKELASAQKTLHARSDQP